MRLRSTAVALVAGLAGLTLLRRRRGARREHVDLYYGDGSMVSLEAGAPEADRLLAIARDGLAAGRG
ncbi:MAG TPA: hypothetical protein VLB86_10680 [Gaiellaceae bacterium]|nr:hypothetical protein [Gaiellaceae bacterium]